MIYRSAVGIFFPVAMQRLMFCEIDLVLSLARSRGPSFPCNAAASLTVLKTRALLTLRSPDGGYGFEPDKSDPSKSGRRTGV